ncbi:MAG TPA: hypothetical protein VFO67_20395 [Gemmatimonadales bacterium]|nr:hypothetical protein [Gemmatimonadales bacterium]
MTRARQILCMTAFAGLAGATPCGAQTASVPPSLILPNYDRLPIGQREGIEGGAFVARTNDAAAAWYNPAGLGQSRRSALNASATAYEWTSMELEGFGTSQGRSRISSIGTLLSFVVGEDVINSRNWRFGFAITSPVVWQPSSIELALLMPGGTEALAYATDVTLDVMIPSLSAAYVPGGAGIGRLRLGAGLGMAITTLTQSIDFSDRVVDTTTVVATRDFSADGQVWHLVPTLGLQWDATPSISFGTRISAPGMRVLGSSRMRLQNSRYTNAEVRDLVFADPEVTMDYRQPFEADVGAAFDVFKGEVEIDVHYFGAVDPYALYASDVAGRLTIDSGAGPTVTTVPFTTTTNSARSVVNVAIGGSRPISRTIRVHVGFSTDQSPVDQSLSMFRQVNLKRFTAGFSLTGERLSGSLGFGYSAGSGTRQTLGSTEGGQQTTTRLNVKAANLLFALSYAVGGSTQ